VLFLNFDRFYNNLLCHKNDTNIGLFSDTMIVVSTDKWWV